MKKSTYHNSLFPSLKDIPLILFYLGTLLICFTTFRLGGVFFNASDLCFLLSVLVLFTNLLINKKSDFLNIIIHYNPLVMPLVLLFYSGLLSLVNTNDLSAGFRVFFQYLFLFGVWIPFSIYELDDIVKIRNIFIVLVLASLIPISVGLSDYFLQTTITSFLNGLLALNLDTVVPEWGRFGNVMNHPNNFGVLLIIVFPLSLWLQTENNKLWIKLFGFVYFISIVACSSTTGSRTVLIAIIFQFIVYHFFFLPQQTSRQLIQLIAIGVISILVLTFITHNTENSAMERLSISLSGDIGEYGADIDRVASMSEAFTLIKRHPLAGVGIDTAGSNLKTLFVHNTIIRLWAGMGIGGLFSVLMFYILPLKAIYVFWQQIKRTENRQITTMLSVLISMISGWMLADMVQPQFHNRIKWVTIILLYALIRFFNKTNQ